MLNKKFKFNSILLSFSCFQIIFLAQYLLQNFGIDPRVTDLVNKTDIWLMPSLNPDGFEKASEGNCYQVSDLFFWLLFLFTSSFTNLDFGYFT